ncbi:12677_t:CDS:2 [Ambispora gerdemannii]|uniref:12677_t:CDS:1 n=1 Tax=Ambispora gerdemannii TaxID=144530 RepID=A0A9N8Z6M5_9GLOM|nr:12677_t:CDS:2 [Ambispora gerdemannii]
MDKLISRKAKLAQSTSKRKHRIGPGLDTIGLPAGGSANRVMVVATRVDAAGSTHGCNLYANEEKSLGYDEILLRPENEVHIKAIGFFTR